MTHRDIKPANIFRDTNKYKLGDFGSACSMEGVDILIGDRTREYLSPEIRRLMLGEKVEVDYFQSDISLWGSLCCISLNWSCLQRFPKPIIMLNSSNKHS